MFKVRCIHFDVIFEMNDWITHEKSTCTTMLHLLSSADEYM